MRNLSLAYGNSRQAKTWVNKTIRFDELKERLKVTIRTPESAEEYAKMNKAQRDQAKDHGGFVGGVLKGGRRKIDTVESRSMLSLDGDRITKEFLDNYETTFPYTIYPAGNVRENIRWSPRESAGKDKVCIQETGR